MVDSEVRCVILVTINNIARSQTIGPDIVAAIFRAIIVYIFAQIIYAIGKDDLN